MQTLSPIISLLGIFLILLCLNAIATGLLVAGQMIITKIAPPKTKG